MSQDPSTGNHSDFDAIVVGASLAGCTAATLLGRAGLNVALVESQKDPAAHKKLCTHFIQPSATPTLQRLGVTDELEAAGAIRNGISMWTRFGWIKVRAEEYDGVPAYGYNIRRSVIDPIVRRTAAETDGVRLMLGTTVRELVKQGDRIGGVKAETDGETIELRAPLVVAADGRHSRLAELAGSEPKLSRNDRFGYFAHYRGVKLDDAEGSSGQMWLLEPAAAYTFVNDDGVTLLTYLGPKSELADFKKDPAGNLLRKFGELPGAPDLSQAEQVSEIRGMTDIPNRRRKPTAQGMAFIGDAAIASDPLWGIGCGWALQSAGWLVDSVARPLAGGDESAIDSGLKTYAKLHRKGLSAHDWFVRDFSKERKFNPIEKLLFKAAVNDQEFAHKFHAFGARMIAPSKFMTPRNIAHAVRASRAAKSPA
ncbi:MAG TPA: NAD(P)/FAD-dependent oxidoreductase [Solirubrobacterales bacterium]|nr:NAD(P)/FAD-dependent oxidoreductase [Solirubrobacterales bacterium]